MKSITLPALLPATVVAALLPAALHAQPPEATLAPVSVTAKGYAAEDLETPVSTSALDRDELLRRNAQNPGEALRGEPGLLVEA